MHSWRLALHLIEHSLTRVLQNLLAASGSNKLHLDPGSIMALPWEVYVVCPKHPSCTCCESRLVSVTFAVLLPTFRHDSQSAAGHGVLRHYCSASGL